MPCHAMDGREHVLIFLAEPLSLQATEGGSRREFVAWRQDAVAQEPGLSRGGFMEGGRWLWSEAGDTLRGVSGA